ncbi:MAG: ABC transporter permease [Rhizobiales bacterium 63-22]|nr:MAG: ABC transporter permease [Rhizobiales bacterium 63-22]
MAKTCLVIFLICLGIVVIYPLLWMALNGFKNNAEIFGNPFSLPTRFTWENYVAAWNQGVRNYVATSVIVTVASAVCTVMISAWTAYGLTRSKMPGKPLVVGIILGGLMLSPTVAVIPLVRMMQELGLYNTYWALILLYTAFRIPFTTFLIRAYMLDLPGDLDEAAIMDGASESQIFWRVTLPLCKPIIVSCVILHVLFAWNEYLFAMIFTSGADVQTLPVGLTSIMAKHGTNYAIVFAAMTISALPIVIVFFAAQRYFIRGLAEGIGK